MYSILICDDNENWVNILETGLSQIPEFLVASKVYDGEAAIEQIENLRPDIIILDIIMPKYDGVYIVNYIRKRMESYNPIIYILSGIGTDTIIRMLNELSVDFYNLKPVALDVVIQNLIAAVDKHGTQEIPTAAHGSSPTKKDSLEENAKDLVLRLGMLPHHISTKCAIDAIVFFAKNPQNARALTKFVYPEIARKHGLSESSVEKNIRYAILVVQKSKTSLFRQIFNYAPEKKITNGEFLSIVADHIGR